MLLVLYSHPMKESLRFYYFKFYLFIYTYCGLLYRKAYLEGHYLRRHIDYSGLEGTKGGARAIRSYFADNQLIWLNKRNVFSVSLLKTVDSHIVSQIQLLMLSLYQTKYKQPLALGS